MTTAFTLLYAVIGLPLARLADRGSRKKLLASGVTVWSAADRVHGAGDELQLPSFFTVGRSGRGSGLRSAGDELVGRSVPAAEAFRRSVALHAGPANRAFAEQFLQRTGGAIVWMACSDDGGRGARAATRSSATCDAGAHPRVVRSPRSAHGPRAGVSLGYFAHPDAVVDHRLRSVTELHHVRVFGLSRFIPDARARLDAGGGGYRGGVHLRHRRHPGRNHRRPCRRLCIAQAERWPNACCLAGRVDIRRRSHISRSGNRRARCSSFWRCSPWPTVSSTCITGSSTPRFKTLSAHRTARRPWRSTSC